MKKSLRISPALCALALLLLPTFVTPALSIELITFELDTPTNKSNGFVSVHSPYVSFSDTVGSSMDVANTAPESIGNALRIFDDGDGSALEMNFTAPVVSLSLDFGNDDPGYTNAGDLALLSLFNGVTPVGTASVVLNRDDIMNQTITFAGGPFNRAVFAYTNSAGSPFTGGGNASTGLIEIVDNITFALVPEPASMILLAVGLCGGITRRRNRQN